MNFNHPNLSFQSSEKIKSFQENALRELISYTASKSNFYKKQWADLKINPSSIQHLEDLEKLPFTEKKDLQDYNWDFLCVPKSEIKDFVSTSGTTGKPIFIGLNKNDLERLAYNEMRSLQIAACSADDNFQLTTTMDKRFMAGLAYYLGVQKLEGSIVRVGAGSPALQWDTIKELESSVIITVPSFFLQMVKYAADKNIDLSNTSLKKCICIGEPIRNKELEDSSISKKIKEILNIELYSTYASTEMATAFTECAHKNGGHHQPELLIVEFIKEDGSKALSGEMGEIVVTPLGMESMPLIRYKTGDVCYHYEETCSCGRNSLRIGPIQGRKNQLIKYRGTSLFPGALIESMRKTSWIKDYLLIIEHDEMGLDQIEIMIKPTSIETFNKELEQLKDEFRAACRVSPILTCCNQSDLNEIRAKIESRKLLTVLDKRPI